MDDHLPHGYPGVSAVEAAIVQAVAYSDIFDYPLTAAEIHRYLVGVAASREAVSVALGNGVLVPHHLVLWLGHYTLAGREEIVETRLRRAAIAASQWPRAAHYGLAMARLPFVRMVAVTGALAMDNVEPDTDIDYLVVTEPDRLWLCRALVVLLVRLAARHGDIVCPNYFLSERALSLGSPNLFTAHELVQMVPLSGLKVYDRMCRLNGWAARFLPNAFGLPRRVDLRTDARNLVVEDGAERDGRPRRLVEAALRTRVGGWLEHWEMARKVRKLTAQGEAPREIRLASRGNGELETYFSGDRCKGHFDSHGLRTLEAYRSRLRDITAAFRGAAGSPTGNGTALDGSAA